MGNNMELLRNQREFGIRKELKSCRSDKFLVTLKVKIKSLTINSPLLWILQI